MAGEQLVQRSQTLANPGTTRRRWVDWWGDVDNGTMQEGGICNFYDGVAGEAALDGRNRRMDEFDNVIVCHVVVQRCVHGTRDTESSVQRPSVQQGVEFRFARGHRVKLSHEQRKDDPHH
ncbi:hypothetical protein [Kribbella antiqua]|uniref:hypothetical protein n=1 Tax=Kribbella antiqua TaxID=2512217 RepID=UPI001044CDBD|nr:hypothetical protein [Kribbella antiqua]